MAIDQHIGVDQAINRVGSLCSERLLAFSSIQDELSSYGGKAADAMSDTVTYVRGLGDCLRGVLHWALESDRYFSSDDTYIRRTLLVEPPGGGNRMQDDVTEEW